MTTEGEGTNDEDENREPKKSWNLINSERENWKKTVSKKKILRIIIIITATIKMLQSIIEK